MKKRKLTLKKFQISKLTNLNTIYGGGNTDDVTKTILTDKPTQQPTQPTNPIPTTPTTPTNPTQQPTQQPTQ